MKINNNINLPNALSAYRILIAPYISWFIINQQRDWFILFLSISLVTDILDGLIARTFKLETEIGAKLDSLADIGTFITAIVGLFVFEYEFVLQHSFVFLTMVILYALPQLIALLKFKQFPSFHLYSFKVTGYLQGIFIFTFFQFGHYAWYFYLMCIVSFIAYKEELIAVMISRNLRSNIKSVYFLLK